ncbi:MAG: c-type cytochrome [Rhodobacteraceae bacterium]|nr:c-type cytochrome [Paracoccaceae bacterium]MBL4807396.1 c-type cytochrome [Paracoccaceae bacterium]
MTAKLVKLGGGLLLALLAQNVMAQDISLGRMKAQRCSGCHGPLGLAVAPNAPNLAGEASLYIEMQLRAFRSGDRLHDQMTIVASRLSDEDIADLAAWFQAIQVVATAPDLN